MIDRNAQLRERWSPHGRRGATGTMGADAILAGSWLSNPAHGTREVDLYAAYRALAQEGMADRLFEAGTGDLAASLARHPHVEHLAGVRMTFSDLGATVVLRDGEAPPRDTSATSTSCAPSSPCAREATRRGRCAWPPTSRSSETGPRTASCWDAAPGSARKKRPTPRWTPSAPS